MMTSKQKHWWIKTYDWLKIYDNWRDAPWDADRWPNFSPWELRSRGDGKLVIDEDALDALQSLRTELGKPVQINSAYRSLEHNANVGGAKYSMHMLGIAFDVSLIGQDRAQLTALAEKHGFNGIGQYRNFIHMDTRPWKARWDKRWRGK